MIPHRNKDCKSGPQVESTILSLWCPQLEAEPMDKEKSPLREGDILACQKPEQRRAICIIGYINLHNIHTKK